MIRFRRHYLLILDFFHVVAWLFLMYWCADLSHRYAELPGSSLVDVPGFTATALAVGQLVYAYPAIPLLLAVPLAFGNYVWLQTLGGSERHRIYQELWAGFGVVIPLVGALLFAFLLTSPIDALTEVSNAQMEERRADGRKQDERLIGSWRLTAAKRGDTTLELGEACLLYTSPSPRDLNPNRG